MLLVVDSSTNVYRWSPPMHRRIKVVFPFFFGDKRFLNVCLVFAGWTNVSVCCGTVFKKERKIKEKKTPSYFGGMHKHRDLPIIDAMCFTAYTVESNLKLDSCLTNFHFVWSFQTIFFCLVTITMFTHLIQSKTQWRTTSNCYDTAIKEGKNRTKKCTKQRRLSTRSEQKIIKKRDPMFF